MLKSFFPCDFSLDAIEVFGIWNFPSETSASADSPLLNRVGEHVLGADDDILVLVSVNLGRRGAFLDVFKRRFV